MVFRYNARNQKKLCWYHCINSLFWFVLGRLLNEGWTFSIFFLIEKKKLRFFSFKFYIKYSSDVIPYPFSLNELSIFNLLSLKFWFSFSKPLITSWLVEYKALNFSLSSLQITNFLIFFQKTFIHLIHQILVISFMLFHSDPWENRWISYVFFKEIVLSSRFFLKALFSIFLWDSRRESCNFLSKLESSFL